MLAFGAVRRMFREAVRPLYEGPFHPAPAGALIQGTKAGTCRPGTG